jgi:hypothetical protein
MTRRKRRLELSNSDESSAEMPKKYNTELMDVKFQSTMHIGVKTSSKLANDEVLLSFIATYKIIYARLAAALNELFEKWIHALHYSAPVKMAVISTYAINTIVSIYLCR